MTTAHLPRWAVPFTRKARYKSVYGGRGSSKTWTVARLIIAEAARTPLKVACCREVQSSIQESAKPALEGAIHALGLQRFFRITRWRIDAANGSRFFFHGLRHTREEIRGWGGRQSGVGGGGATPEPRGRSGAHPDHPDREQRTVLHMEPAEPQRLGLGAVRSSIRVPTTSSARSTSTRTRGSRRSRRSSGSTTRNTTPPCTPTYGWASRTTRARIGACCATDTLLKCVEAYTQGVVGGSGGFASGRRAGHRQQRRR